MKILVTGATGFLGHHLVKKLKKGGYQIKILKEKSASTKLLDRDIKKIEIVEGDIRNQEDVESAVNGCDVVFHLVGMISYWNKLNNLQKEINVEGTKNVVNACLKYNAKLIYASSNTTIGVEKEKLADENTIYNLFPLKINYCDTKFLAEVEVYKGIAKGLEAIIICPASMYGEGDTRKIKTDMTFDFEFPLNLFYPSGGISVVDVEDVAEGMIKAWHKEKNGERYIFVGENLSFYQIRKTIAKELGKKPPFLRIPAQLFSILSYVFLGISKITGKKPKLTPEIASFNKIKFHFSNKKAKKELKIEFTTFKESIKKAIAWYKENGYL